MLSSGQHVVESPRIFCGICKEYSAFWGEKCNDHSKITGVTCFHCPHQRPLEKLPAIAAFLCSEDSSRLYLSPSNLQIYFSFLVPPFQSLCFTGVLFSLTLLDCLGYWIPCLALISS